MKQLQNILVMLNSSKFGLLSFNVGLFFLFSAPAISVIFILGSLIYAYSRERDNPFNDWINKSFLIIVVLMIASCIFFKLFNQEIEFKDNFLEYTHPLIGLFNWIPLFLSFWGFQYYLRTKEHRKIAGISLICSTIPVLLSGIGQYYLNFYGPYNFLNGLIIWYQRDNQSGLTSLFNNQNYAGCVLTTTWPFFFAAIFNKKNNLSLSIFSVLLNFVVVLEILLTNSRNSFIGLLIGFFILLIPLRLKKKFFVLITIFCSIILSVFVKLFFNFYFPVFNIFSRLNFENFVSDPRIEIWKSSLGYILKKPILGWGGNGFSSIWNYQNDEMYLHSHSTPLEISIQYGIFTSLILTSVILFLIIKSYKKIFFENGNKIINFYKDNQFDRAWFTGTIIIIFSNTFDILYFDLRTNILMWVLLAGLRNVIKEKYV